MNKSKSTLQKMSIVMGALSFLLAVVCAVALHFKVEELGMQHTISASLLASTFFFVFIGFVLIVMGKADLPSFRFDETTPPEH